MRPLTPASAGESASHLRCPSSLPCVWFSMTSLRPFLWEYDLEIVLHADDQPAAPLGLVEGAIELSDRGRPVIGELARGVVVAQEQHQPRAVAAGGVLQ